MHILVHHGCRVGGEFANDFLENILDRHQALNVAVLIDHECHAALVALKIQQLRVECRSRGNEVRFARLGRGGQGVLIQVTACQFMHDLLHVQKADDAVDFALIHRQARVLTLPQLLQDPVPIIIDVDADDFVSRHHDVLDGGILQIQNADEHLLVAPRNHRAGLGHDGAQLFAAQGICRDLSRDAEHPQHAVGEEIRHPYEGIQQKQQGCVDVRGRQRQTLGMQSTEGFGRHLAKNQQHECQQQCAEGHQEFAADSQRDEAHQNRRDHVDDGAEKQDQSDQTIRALEQRLGQARAAAAFIGSMPQAIAVHAHQGGFAAGEKCGQNQQSRQRREQKS